VLRAIEFDYQKFFRCTEIREERPNRKLPFKSDAMELSASETTP
jgi:hypothetical protein